MIGWALLTAMHQPKLNGDAVRRRVWVDLRANLLYFGLSRPVGSRTRPYMAKAIIFGMAVSAPLVFSATCSWALHLNYVGWPECGHWRTAVFGFWHRAGGRLRKPADVPRRRSQCIIGGWASAMSSVQPSPLLLGWLAPALATTVGIKLTC